MSTKFKKDVARRVVSRLEDSRIYLSSRKSEEVVDAVFAAIQAELTLGNTVQITRFGIFKPVVRKERKVPRPGGEFEIVPAKKVVRFTPGASLSESVSAAARLHDKVSAS